VNGLIRFVLLLALCSLHAVGLTQAPVSVWVPVSTSAEREVDLRSLQADGLVVTFLARHAPSGYVMRVQLRCGEQLRGEMAASTRPTGLIATVPIRRYPDDKQQESAFACAFAQGNPQVLALVAAGIQSPPAAPTAPSVPGGEVQSAGSDDQPLELYCQVENLEASCSDVRTVEHYRFLRTCVTSNLRNGGYVAFTDDFARASKIPDLCAGASIERINQTIRTHGGTHAARLLQMAEDLQFDASKRFAALSGASLPKAAAKASPPPVAPPTPALPERRTTAVKSSGTGFAVSAGDVVLTNEHVVAGCSRLSAAAGDQEFDVKVIATDEASDLAAVRLLGARLSALPLSTAPEDLGGEIVVLGFPLTSVLGNDLRITTGVISALSGVRGERKVMQVSAAVQPGNSGGPVIDLWGGVDGVIVAKLGSRFSAENVNFAVRVPVVRSFLELNGLHYVAHRRALLLRPADIVRKMGHSVVQLKCY
jgi:S1-C subfamily serine protease